MALFEVDDENFQEVLDKEFSKAKIIILKFGSEFCDACLALDTELEQVEDNNENISIISVDCDASPEIAESYDVYQLPTMIIFNNKEEVIYENEGVVLSEDIQKIIDVKL